MYRNRPVTIVSLSRFNERRYAMLAFSFALILISMMGWFRSAEASAQSSPSSAPSLQFHHATLSVNDVDLMSQWYVDRLDFTITDRFTLTRPNGSQIEVARVEIPGLRLNLSKFPDSVPRDQRVETQGWRHIAFEVADLDRTYQQLRSQGIQFITEPYTYDPPGFRVVFFKDPEGNILELYQE